MDEERLRPGAHHVDWRLTIRFKTSVPADMIRGMAPETDQWSIPAGLLRSRLRAQLERMVESLPDSTARRCRGGNDPSAADCLAAAPGEACLLCRTFGSAFMPSPLHVSAAGLTGPPPEVMLRTRSTTRYRQGSPLDAGNIIEVTPPGLVFTASLRGNPILSPAELTLLAGSIRTITRLGWGGGYGLSQCRIDIHDLAVDAPIPPEPLAGTAPSHPREGSEPPREPLTATLTDAATTAASPDPPTATPVETIPAMVSEPIAADLESLIEDTQPVLIVPLEEDAPPEAGMETGIQTGMEIGTEGDAALEETFSELEQLAAAESVRPGPAPQPAEPTDDGSTQVEEAVTAQDSGQTGIPGPEEEGDEP